jgi:hypothetical protein
LRFATALATRIAAKVDDGVSGLRHVRRPITAGRTTVLVVCLLSMSGFVPGFTYNIGAFPSSSVGPILVGTSIIEDARAVAVHSTAIYVIGLTDGALSGLVPAGSVGMILPRYSSPHSWANRA